MVHLDESNLAQKYALEVRLLEKGTGCEGAQDWPTGGR